MSNQLVSQAPDERKVVIEPSIESLSPPNPINVGEVLNKEISRKVDHKPFLNRELGESGQENGLNKIVIDEIEAENGLALENMSNDKKHEKIRLINKQIKELAAKNAFMKGVAEKFIPYLNSVCMI